MPKILILVLGFPAFDERIVGKSRKTPAIKAIFMRNFLSAFLGTTWYLTNLIIIIIIIRAQKIDPEAFSS